MLSLLFINESFSDATFYEFSDINLIAAPTVKFRDLGNLLAYFCYFDCIDNLLSLPSKVKLESLYGLFESFI